MSAALYRREVEHSPVDSLYEMSRQENILTALDHSFAALQRQEVGEVHLSISTVGLPKLHTLINILFRSPQHFNGKKWEKAIFRSVASGLQKLHTLKTFSSFRRSISTARSGDVQEREGDPICWRLFFYCSNLKALSLRSPQHFNGKKWEKFNSEKVASLAYARIQGKAALVAHFQNSSLMNEDKRCRPILFHSDGERVGDQVGCHVSPLGCRGLVDLSSIPPSTWGNCLVSLPQRERTS